MSLLSYAIQMETDGEQYYRRQAEMNTDTTIARAFELVARAEHRHAELLRGLAEGKPEDFDAEKISAENGNIFSSLGDFKRDASKVPTQLEAYKEAQILEDLSIRLYERMLEAASDAKTRKLLEFLVSQERQHYAMFESLGEIVAKPEQYVHHPQFSDARHMNRSSDDEEY